MANWEQEHKERETISFNNWTNQKTFSCKRNQLYQLHLFHDTEYPVPTCEVMNERHQPVKQRKIESMKADMMMNTFRKLYCEVQFNRHPAESLCIDKVCCSVKLSKNMFWHFKTSVLKLATSPRRQCQFPAGAIPWGCWLSFCYTDELSWADPHLPTSVPTPVCLVYMTWSYKQ